MKLADIIKEGAGQLDREINNAIGAGQASGVGRWDQYDLKAFLASRTTTAYNEGRKAGLEIGLAALGTNKVTAEMAAALRDALEHHPYILRRNKLHGDTRTWVVQLTNEDWRDRVGETEVIERYLTEALAQAHFDALFYERACRVVIEEYFKTSPPLVEQPTAPGSAGG